MLISAFWNAIAAGEALLENGGTEDEMWKALTELETQQGLVDEMKVNLPAADKKYHLVIGYDGFYAKQGVQKAMYARGDSVVWWQTADATSIGQEFVLNLSARWKTRHLSIRCSTYTPTATSCSIQKLTT